MSKCLNKYQKLLDNGFGRDHISKRLLECSLPIVALVQSAMYSTGVTLCDTCTLKPFILFLYISALENVPALSSMLMNLNTEDSSLLVC